MELKSMEKQRTQTQPWDHSDGPVYGRGRDPLLFSLSFRESSNEQNIAETIRSKRSSEDFECQKFIYCKAMQVWDPNPIRGI